MKNVPIVVAAGAVLAAAGFSTADTVNLFFMATNSQNSSGLTGFGTNGALMDNMSLTVTFADLTTNTALWADTGAVSGAAVGAGWSVSESGDTFASNWTFSNTSGKTIKSLVIDAGAGDTLFDTTFGGAFGSAGSFRGQDFAITSANQGFVLDATYSGEIGIGGNAAVGDLFRFLKLEWLNTGNPFVSGKSITYVQDTDNLAFAGELIPLPGGAAMAMVGMGVIGVRRRRG
jgi:hypothetical protein